MAGIRLIAVPRSGALPAEVGDSVPALLREIASVIAKQHEADGYLPPWVGYVALDGPDAIGLGGFKGPPTTTDDGVQRVEIAYFTLPEQEGKGYATAIARGLVRLSQEAAPEVVVAAQTLREEGASTKILRKLGFELDAELLHPEDGEIWEWRLA